MTQALHARETYQEVLDWLNEQATTRGIAEDFRALVIRKDNNWLHVAIKLGAIRDIGERASLLQQLEDAWDEKKPRPYWHLLLVPSAGA